MPSTYVFYHEDADGHCAAAVFKYSCEQSGQNEELDLRAINHGYDADKMFGDLETGARLVFLDFCPPEEDLKALHDKGFPIVVVDHHKSSEWAKDYDTTGTNTKPYIRVYHSIYQSGCEITWGTFMGEAKMPPAVWMTGRYDVWDHQADERIVPFITGMKLIITDPVTEDGYEFWKACFETIDTLPADAPDEERAKRMKWDVVLQLINMGNVAHMYRLGLAEERERNVHDMVIEGKKFLMVNSKLSDSYDFPMQKLDDSYFGFGWYYWDGKEWHFSMRSEGDNDLTTVAGIRGHKNAAGFTMYGFQDPSIYLKAANESN